MKYTKNFYQIKSNTEILKKIKAERRKVNLAEKFSQIS